MRKSDKKASRPLFPNHLFTINKYAKKIVNCYETNTKRKNSNV